MQFISKDAKVIISQILFRWHKKFRKREEFNIPRKKCMHKAIQEDTSTEDDNDTMIVDT